MTLQDLTTDEYAPYYRRYLDKLPAHALLIPSFTHGQEIVTAFFTAIPKDKLNFAYAENKWTIKQVFQHLIDTERVFMYRCLRFARNDKTVLADFDQSVFIEPSGANTKSLEALLQEFETTRRYSLQMLHSFTPEALVRIGHIQIGPMSARAAAFIVPGHDQWHMDIIKERYVNT
ncbi:MAG: DinB family protein [Bacteroidota bacterium]